LPLNFAAQRWPRFVLPWRPRHHLEPKMWPMVRCGLLFSLRFTTMSIVTAAHQLF
jgi:hypothetical protein